MNPFHLGLHVFTTLRIENRVPIFLADHLNRLKSHAEHFSFIYPGHRTIENALTPLCLDTLPKRVSISVGASWNLEYESFIPPAQNLYHNGVNIHFSSYQVHPQLAAFKTGNYLPYFLAREEAHRQGAFEATLNDASDYVVDGSRTSILLYRENNITVLRGGLKGITCHHVIEEAKRLGVKIQEMRLKKEELIGQILLCGTGVGVLSVGHPHDDVVKRLIQQFKPQSS